MGWDLSRGIFAEIALMRLRSNKLLFKKRPFNLETRIMSTTITFKGGTTKQTINNSIDNLRTNLPNRMVKHKTITITTTLKGIGQT